MCRGVSIGPCRFEEPHASGAGMRTRPAIALLVATTFSAAQAVAWRGSDAVTVRTSPEGARVHIDGEYLGDTPLNVPVPCNEVVDRRYRIEHPDCRTEEGILSARPRPGVIVGMVFTLGILAAFMCPKYFVPVRLALGGERCNPILDTAPKPIGSGEPTQRWRSGRAAPTAERPARPRRSHRPTVRRGARERSGRTVATAISGGRRAVAAGVAWGLDDEYANPFPSAATARRPPMLSPRPPSAKPARPLCRAGGRATRGRGGARWRAVDRVPRARRSSRHDRARRRARCARRGGRSPRLSAAGRS